jgi:hypothetical protein
LAARAAKISAATKGKPKLSPGNRMGGARKCTPEQNAFRAERVKAAWARKTPEELEAWKAKCRAVKEGAPGNIENLRKGWEPEVQERARVASAEARRPKS